MVSANIGEVYLQCCEQVINCGSITNAFFFKEMILKLDALNGNQQSVRTLLLESSCIVVDTKNLK